MHACIYIYIYAHRVVHETSDISCMFIFIPGRGGHAGREKLKMCRRKLEYVGFFLAGIDRSIVKNAIRW